MAELFEALKHEALLYHISIFDFWGMTYGEIVDTLTAYKEREREDLKQKAAMTHANANLIALSVARLLDKNAKYPELYDAFPDLFEKERKKLAEPVQQDWQIAKARLLEYANAHNKKRGKAV